MEKGGVVTNRQPLDVLTLMFRYTELGGDCAVLLRNNTNNVPIGVKERWLYVECVRAQNKSGHILRGVNAIKCIAGKGTFSTDIVDIVPRKGIACQCYFHQQAAAALRSVEILNSERR